MQVESVAGNIFVRSTPIAHSRVCNVLRSRVVVSAGEPGVLSFRRALVSGRTKYGSK